MKKIKNKSNLLFILVFILMCINQSYSTSIDEIVNYYDYSYSNGLLNISNISILNQSTNNIIFNLDIIGTEGNYEFIYGVKDKNIETYKDEFKNINKIHSSIRINRATIFLLLY